MKVVALIVVFLVIWQWTRSSPLPCVSDNCPHCKHTQLDAHISDIVRSKKDVLSIKNITEPIKQAVGDVEKSLHILRKRETSESYLKTEGVNVTAKGATVSESEKSIQNTTKNKREIPSLTNISHEIHNTTRAIRQNFHYKQDVHETHNDTKVRRTAIKSENHNHAGNKTFFKRQINVKNDTQYVQNLTDVKRDTFEKTFKRQISNIKDNAHNITRIKQTFNNNNTLNAVKTNGENFDHKNNTLKAQNTTKVIRQIYNIGNKQKQQETRIIKRQSFDIKSKTKTAQEKMTAKKKLNNQISQIKSMVKRQTSINKNITSNLTETGLNKTIVMRQATNTEIDPGEAQNTTLVKRQISDTVNTTQRGQNETKEITVKRAAIDHENIAEVAENKTLIKKHTNSLKNVQNKSEISRVTGNTKDDIRSNEQTVRAKRQLSSHKNDSNETQNTSTKLKREIFDPIMHNSTSNNDIMGEAKVKRLTINSDNKSVYTETTKDNRKRSFSKRDDELEVLNIQKPLEKPKNTTKLSGHIFIFKCITQPIVSLAKPNCTLKVFDITNSTKDENYTAEVQVSNKIRRQTSEATKDGLTSEDNQKTSKEKGSLIVKEPNTKKEDNKNDANNITIHIRNFMEDNQNDIAKNKMTNVKSYYKSLRAKRKQVEDVKDIKENLTRIRKGAEGPKNITIQIQNYLYENSIRKTKRYSNDVTENDNETKRNESLVKTKRNDNETQEDSAANITKTNFTINTRPRRSDFSYTEKLNASNTNDTREKNQEISRSKRENVKDFNFYQDDSTPQEQASQNIRTQKSLSKTKKYSQNHHRGKRNLAETLKGNTRITRSVFKTQGNDTSSFKNESKNAEQIKRHISTLYETDNSTAPRNFSLSQKSTSKNRTTRFIDEKHTYIMKITRRASETSKNESKINKMISQDQKNVSRKRRSTWPQNRNDIEKASSRESFTLGRNDKEVLKQFDESQLNNVKNGTKNHLPVKLINKQVLVSFSRLNDDESNEMNSELEHITTNEMFDKDSRNMDDKMSSQENLLLDHSHEEVFNKLIGRYLENYKNNTKLEVPIKHLSQVDVTFAGLKNGETIKNSFEVNRDTEKNMSNNSENSIQNNEQHTQNKGQNKEYLKHIFFINEVKNSIENGFYILAPDRTPEDEEVMSSMEDDINTDKLRKNIDHIRCACAMYRSDSLNKDKSTSFTENDLKFPLEKDQIDKKVLCTKSCSEIAKIHWEIKQEVSCAHIKYGENQLKKVSPQDQMPLQKDPELIFCQVFTEESEPTLQFVLSWVNVVLLDVVVCLTGLGIVCMYMICFVTWKKRNCGHTYRPPTFAAKK